MAHPIEIKVPDIGDFDSVPVIEVLVAVGDSVEKEQSLVTLESDKATMEIPSSAAGTVKEVKVKVGDEVAQGSVIVVLEATDAGAEPHDGEADARPASVSSSSEESRSSQSSPAVQGNGPAREARDSTETGGASSDSRGGSDEVDTAARASTERGTSPEGYSLSSTQAAIADEASGGSRADAPQPAAASGRKPDMECQLLVLGSGPGGYTAAFRGADIEQDVILVERYATLGGVCLNVGCIPSKALLHAAEVIDAAESFAAHGISFGRPKLDLDKLRDYKTKVVGKLTGGLTSMSKSRKVRVVTGVGVFVSPHELEVETDDGKKLIRFDNAIIAAGSESVKLPAFPWDDDRIVDSTGALELRDVPKKLLVVGGGIIGLEMATVYAALGSEVTIVEFLDQLIPGADADLVKPLAQRLGKRVKGIHLKTKVTSANATKNGIEVGYEGDNAPKNTLFDRVLVAVGRSPNGGKLGAEKAGVAVTERGFINVDPQMRTNVPHIYAIGDLVGQPMLAHKATHEAKVAAEAAAGMKSYFDARVIPSVAYTDPELAWVGVTEREAREKGLKIGVGKFPWAALGRAIGMDRTEGVTKLIFDEETHRIVGGGIVGVHAGDLIAEITLAIEMGAEAGDIGRTIHPHPTLSESVGMAADVYEGTITDLYIPKKKK